VYICVCNAVTDGEIRRAVALGARSLRDLKDRLAVATSCGKCASSTHSVLRIQGNQSLRDDAMGLAKQPA
jgi:bacterioferritin-associated ferredoxin